MVRKYKRTGNPPGRPRKIVRPDTGLVGVGPDAVTPEQFEAVRAAVDRADAGRRSGRPPGQLMTLPQVNLAGIKDEDQARAAVTQILAGLHDQLPRLLEQMAPWEPDKVVQFYKDMAEFVVPKLSRVEQSGTLNHNVQHFVAVEEREAPPISLRPDKDGVFRENGGG